MPSVYEIVTDRIKKQLESGVVPWRKPWKGMALPVSWKTQKPYRGVNLLTLEPGEYITKRQLEEIGGRVKKGEKYHMVYYFKWMQKEDPETGEKETYPIFRFYKVYEVSQCEGVNRKTQLEQYNHDPIQKAEEIVQKYKDRPEITYHPSRAFYRPSQDIIGMPSMSQFEKPEEYYSTLFHELVHSTGHPKRLNRKGFMEYDFFGDENYSKEELVAELGASFLCAFAGIDNNTITNSAAYIQGWLQALQDDKKLIVHAASAAQKAVDYIMGVEFDEMEEKGNEKETVLAEA